ncbi:uncharacterized protein LOC133804814 isoform X2 [Humulus lupulus]|uniref:uncharacterized protein LOC133804814 isoform X2 n=1 Tax=Humulus lupulus TaxID=3486 RepID=UPI002B4031BC|nr:uncharacterized protein LOC133804814 isoform X2 [Humulus lupulus]
MEGHQDIHEEETKAVPYTDIKVARDGDLIAQIGRGIYFDLVNHDKVRNFRIPNHIPFYQFKEKVAKEFGVPVKFQRYWMWGKRKNNTYRPVWPLTSLEEELLLGKSSNKKSERQEVLQLFLEVELDLDLQPVAPPQKTKEDILLFFKLYDPWKKELRYVGRLFAKLDGNPNGILKKLNKMAGFNPNEEIKLFEEIRFEPDIWCEPIDSELTFRCSELQDGDIICFQKSQGIEQCHCPDVPSFFEYLFKHKGDFVEAQPSSQTINTDAHVTELSPSQRNITQEQSTQVAIHSDICTQAVAHVTLLTKHDAVEIKMTPIPSAPLLVHPHGHPHQEDSNVVETETCSSSLASFDALFADIQSLLEVRAVEAGSSSRLQRSMLSIDEITNAHKIVKQCLDTTLGNFIQSGRTREFKNSVSIMLAVNSFPDSKVDEITKFVDDFNQTCERYEGAEQDIREAEQKVSSIIELKTSLKQLSSKFIPTRNRVEEVDREIADMERQLGERKAEKAQLQSNLEDLAGKATASRQALINAELDMMPLWLKKEEAEKTVDDIEKSWESLKDHCFPLRQ